MANKFIPLLLAGCCLLLGACSKPKPTDFFMLQADSRAYPMSGGEFDHNLRLGLGPVRAPDYLNRPQLLVETAENRFELQENHYWAERLEQNITRTLAQFLSQRLGVDQLALYPWPQRQEIDFQITLDILQLHQGADGFSRFQALWRIQSREKTLIAKHFDCKMPAAARAEEMVKAQSLCLTQLGAEIETALRQLPPPS